MLSLFSNKMYWMRSGTELSQFLRVSTYFCCNDIPMQVWRKSIHYVKGYCTYKTITLKIRSWSPKTKHIISLSERYIHASLVNIHQLVKEISHFSDNLTSLGGLLTSKIRSRSINSWNHPSGKSLQVWWQSRQWLISLF